MSVTNVPVPLSRAQRLTQIDLRLLGADPERVADPLAVEGVNVDRASKSGSDAVLVCGSASNSDPVERKPRWLNS